MVNFDNDTTVSKPSKELVNYIILQRHTELIDAIANYELRQLKDLRSGIMDVQSKAIALYFSIMEMLDKEIANEIHKK